MQVLQAVPDWVLRPLPAHAQADPELMARIEEHARGLPGSIGHIDWALSQVSAYREYDPAANLASAHVWHALDAFFSASDWHVRAALLAFAENHLVLRAKARIFRRLAKDPAWAVRQRARKFLARSPIHEVALPCGAEDNWDTNGWFRGLGNALSRHKQGARVQARFALPPLANLAQLRELLGIRSPRQLGFLLLASDKDKGPYTCFTIAKADGSERIISAPGPQLLWVQRRLLEKILSLVPTHNAAHGFVSERSTVTNAAPHQGAEVILKFDLADFFPTIHYYRVLGLFVSLGYTLGNGRFGTADDSDQVAPTLARLCCYTPDPYRWGNAVLPQGAPTSPALSNLVCRRLDARLTGLAQRTGGVYSRYADDLTFSFKTAPKSVGRLRWWVDQICHQEGFLLNQRKFHVIRRSQRQLVTGIVVNDTLRVPREERRRFRAILHNCAKHGLASQARQHPRFADYLRGFASYVHMVDPEEGAELLRQVMQLLGHAQPEGEA